MKRLPIKKLLALLLTSQASGFVSPSWSIRTSNSRRTSFSLTLTNNNDDDGTKNNPFDFRNFLADNKRNNSNNNDESTSKNSLIAFRKFRGPIIIGLLAFQSVVNLVTRDFPPILTNQPNADYFGAVLDAIFLSWAGTNFVLQTGILENEVTDAQKDNGISLEGLECKIIVDIGREPGTWMDKDWASSGARLVLPVTVRFTNEVIDLGIPIDLAMGGRYCRKLEIIDDRVSFVGLEGQVDVPVKCGGWTTVPILDSKLENGERSLRFFLDFPSGAQRNDVSIPAGKVFFSSAVLTPDAASNNARAILSPDGSGLFPEGGVTIKSDGGLLNLWGAAGDVNLILGRYSVQKR